jgi:predicted ferric reductase
VPVVERRFGGLDRMYRFHRKLGATVAALLAVHVLAMLGAQAAADQPVGALLHPDPGWRVFTGVVGLGGLAALLSLTAVARLRHETFMAVHRLLGLVFVVGATHALRVPAFRGQSVWLNGHLIAVTVLGVTAWLYRSGLGRTFVHRWFYELRDVRSVHPQVVELTLEPLEEPLAFTPGQLVFVGLDDDAVGRELHPFSITSAPDEATLRLVVKAVGDFTTQIRDATPGSMVKVEGPYGRFWHDGTRYRRQVWVAGGICITPFLSMARSLGEDAPAIDCYYCTEDADAMLFIDELYAIADRHPTLRIIPIRADALGFLTADDVRAGTGDLTGWHLFLCGPPAMIDVLTAQFRAQGLPGDRLHFEDFRLRGR